MNVPSDLTRVLAGGGPLLLDFDGPVCSIFAGRPAAVVAVELCGLLAALGVTASVPVESRSDPLEVLRWAGRLGRHTLDRRLDDELRAVELQAVGSARSTPHAEGVLRAAADMGRPVGIVSNNSDQAISAYLHVHGLRPWVAVVVGRAYAEPWRMKPDPDPVLRAARGLGAAATPVLVGDSTTDVAAARAAGVRSVGYANKPGKAQRLADAGADVVIDSMAALAAALQAGGEA